MNKNIPQIYRVLLTGAAALTLLGPATAARAEVPDAPLDTPTVTGDVLAVAYGGDTVYVGGEFTFVKVGARSYQRERLAAFDARTGALLPWSPSVDGTVRGLAVAGGAVYAAGQFGQADGTGRDSLAKFDATSGALDPRFTFSVTGNAYTVAARDGRLYLGGALTAVSGQARGGLAAFDLATGALDAHWRPMADDQVTSIYPTAGRIYVAGKFHAVDRRKGTLRIAALNPGSGAVDGSFVGALPYIVNAVTASDTSVYAAQGGPGGRITALTRDGSARWSQTTDGDTQAVAVLNGTVYVGGHFDNVCRTSRVADTHGTCLDGRVVRVKLFAVSESGILSSWLANGNGVKGVLAVAADPVHARLAVGGAFTTINGKARNRFVQFS